MLAVRVLHFSNCSREMYNDLVTLYQWPYWGDDDKSNLGPIMKGHLALEGVEAL